MNAHPFLAKLVLQSYVDMTRQTSKATRNGGPSLPAVLARTNIWWSALAGAGAGALTLGLVSVLAGVIGALGNIELARLLIGQSAVLASAATAAVALRAGGWKALLVVELLVLLVVGVSSLEELLRTWRCAYLGQLGCVGTSTNRPEPWQVAAGSAAGAVTTRLLGTCVGRTNPLLETIGILGILVAPLTSDELWLTAVAQFGVFAIAVKVVWGAAAGSAAILVIEARARQPRRISLVVAATLLLVWWVREAPSLAALLRGPLPGVVASVALLVPVIPLLLSAFVPTRRNASGRVAT